MQFNPPFKVYVDGRSGDIQKHLFKLGCRWNDGQSTVTHEHNPFLYVSGSKSISVGNLMVFFKRSQYPELTADQVLSLEKPEPQFKPFDRVLVRDVDYEAWGVDLYSHRSPNISQNSSLHVCLGCSWWYCLPYEGNEHLLGTTDTPE